MLLDTDTEIDLGEVGWVSQGTLDVSAATYEVEFTNAVGPTLADCIRFLPSSLATVATPTISPVETSITTQTLITLSCATEGATIWYTTRSNDDPRLSLSRTEYLAPFRLTAGTKTLRVFAELEDTRNSDLLTVGLTISLMGSAGKPKHLARGLTRKLGNNLTYNL